MARGKERYRHVPSGESLAEPAGSALPVRAGSLSGAERVAASGRGPRRRTARRWAAVAGLAGLLVSASLAGCDGKKDPYEEQGPFPASLAPVTSGAAPSAPPVPFESPAALGDKVSVTVAEVKPVRSQGQGTGEFSGQPAVAFTLTLSNESGETVSLDAASVTATYGAEQTPATPDSGAAVRPFTGTLKSGNSASGVYVFMIPEDRRDAVSIVVSYDAAKPAAIFVGRAD